MRRRRGAREDANASVGSATASVGSARIPSGAWGRTSIVVRRRDAHAGKDESVYRVVLLPQLSRPGRARGGPSLPLRARDVPGGRRGRGGDVRFAQELGVSRGGCRRLAAFRGGETLRTNPTMTPATLHRARGLPTSVAARGE